MHGPGPQRSNHLSLRQPFTPQALYLKPGWSSRLPSVMDREGHSGFKETQLLWHAKSLDGNKLITFCACVCVKFTLTFHVFYNCSGFCFYLSNKLPKIGQRQKLALLFLWEMAVKPVPPARLFSIYNFQSASLLCENTKKVPEPS